MKIQELGQVFKMAGIDSAEVCKGVAIEVRHQFSNQIAGIENPKVKAVAAKELNKLDNYLESKGITKAEIFGVDTDPVEPPQPEAIPQTEA